MLWLPYSGSSLNTFWTMQFCGHCPCLLQTLIPTLILSFTNSVRGSLHCSKRQLRFWCTILFEHPTSFQLLFCSSDRIFVYEYFLTLRTITTAPVILLGLPYLVLQHIIGSKLGVIDVKRFSVREDNKYNGSTGNVQLDWNWINRLKASTVFLIIWKYFFELRQNIKNAILQSEYFNSPFGLENLSTY